MKPLSSWSQTARNKIAGVFTDIDDTLITESAITPDALEALHNLKTKGLMVIPVTGRPVGWSMPFAATWPVDAMVVENGAVALLHNKPTNQVSKTYQQDLATRTHNFQKNSAHCTASPERNSRDVYGTRLTRPRNRHRL
jgi:hypothetical protein